MVSDSSLTIKIYSQSQIFIEDQKYFLKHDFFSVYQPYKDLKYIFTFFFFFDSIEFMYICLQIQMIYLTGIPMFSSFYYCLEFGHSDF